MRAKSYDTNAPQGRNPVCIVPTRNFTLFWFSRQWQVAIGNAVTRLALRHQWQHCVGGVHCSVLCINAVWGAWYRWQGARCRWSSMISFDGDEMYMVIQQKPEDWSLSIVSCAVWLDLTMAGGLLWNFEWLCRSGIGTLWISRDLPRTKVGMDQNKRNNANVSKRHKNIR